MSAKRKIRFGIIGCGLMGREFAVASARWPALLDMRARPEIIAICDLNKNLFHWYTENFESVKIITTNYLDLLSEKDIDFIYCAVPHNLHEKFYTDIIRAGKHLLGEKPFGIDIEANKRILEVVKAHPHVFVRCSSEFPFFPGPDIWRPSSVAVVSQICSSHTTGDDQPLPWIGVFHLIAGESSDHVAGSPRASDLPSPVGPRN